VIRPNPASEEYLRKHLKDFRMSMDPELVRWYDRDGARIDYIRYMFLKQFDEYCRVAEDQIADVWVSTVWLGMDSSFRFAGDRPQPLIFETMLFCDRRDYWDNECWRYCTEAQAISNHLFVVAAIRAEVGQLLP